MTYYPAQETVAGIDLDIMKVVRIKRLINLGGFSYLGQSKNYAKPLLLLI